MPEEGLSLERWANFYLVASTAAATLLGLLFILITLAAERRPKETRGIRLYLTPTVVLFGSVLCLAALLTFPTQSRFTASLCACLVGGAGILYSASLLVMRDGGQKPRWVRACAGYFPAPPHDRSGVAAEQALMIAVGSARIAACFASPAPGLQRRSPIEQPGRSGRSTTRAVRRASRAASSPI